MAKKDVELFFEEVNKNETLKKELEKAEAGMTNLKENELESFFKEKFLPIVKKYGFNFSYDDLREYKHSLTPQSGEELDDDFLDQVAGGAGKNTCIIMGVGVGGTRDKDGKIKSFCFGMGIGADF